MLEIRIKSYDAVIGVRTPDAHLIEYLSNNRMLRSHIPGFAITTDTPDWEITHRHNHQGTVQYSTERKEVLVDGIFGQHTSEHDFSFLALTLFSRCHEEKGRTVFHSGAVSDGHNAHLLLGRRGGGKSILVTELTYKRGMALVSAENTLVDVTNALAGTSIVSNRIPCLAKRYPELLNPEDRQSENDYDAKSYLPSQLIQAHATLPQPIASISFVNVDDDLDTMRYSVPPQHAVIYELLFNSGAYVSGSGHTFMNFTQPHPDLDTHTLRQNRLDLLRALVKNTRVQELRGSVNKIAEYLTGEQK